MLPKEFADKITQLKVRLDELNVRFRHDVLKSFLNDERSVILAIIKEETQIADTLQKLYYYGLLTVEDKKFMIEKIVELLSFLKNQSAINKGSNEYQYVEIIINNLDNMLEHESSYLEYVPGAENKEYIRLSDVLLSKYKRIVFNKKLLLWDESKLFYNEKEVQGVKLIERSGEFFVEIIGEHYSDEEGIRRIYSLRALNSSSNRFTGIGIDPYCYIAEPGKLNNKSENEIKKILGAANANATISVKVIAPIYNVWIRIQEGTPAKFAIESQNLPIQPPKWQVGYTVKIRDRIYNWVA